eukprot:TRINITY_DN2194_c0_g1_i2.p1 TRINITY_DN2194_c0_g1~~TRINITY_DN2194_c0_g1_i2.p1  ORF type:complete len:813 (-),score=131.78 TRINITY_DN2194_c0_g1_i2:450-2888(-)
MSVDALSRVMEQLDSVNLFGMSASKMEDFILDHAPSVINLPALLTEHTMVLISFPGPLFADFKTAPLDLMVARREYFWSLAIQLFTIYMLLGVAFTFMRNFVNYHMFNESASNSYSYRPACDADTENASPWYQRVQPQSARLGQVLQAVLHSRAFLGVVVIGQTTILTLVAMLCVTHGTMASHLGVGYEYWVVYTVLNFSGPLLEVIVSGCRDGELPPMAYPDKAVMACLPLLSEKYDCAKDIVLSAVSLSRDEPICAAMNLMIVFASQAYFIYNSSVKGELVEAYCPILTTPLNRYSVEATEDTPGTSECEKASKFIKTGLTNILLKQTTPARRLITLAEDLPQSIVTLYLAIKGKAAWFCLISLAVSMARLVMTTPTVAQVIRRRGLLELRSRRLKGIRSGNSALALGATKELLGCDGEAFHVFSHDDYEGLVALLANSTEPELLYSEAHNPHCVVLLISAAAVLDPSGVAVDELFESLDVDVNNAYIGQTGGGWTLAHLAAQVGDIRCLEKLQQLGADLDSKDDFGCTPMHLAAQNGHMQAIATLKQLGADLESKDRDGCTPMHAAANRGKVQAIATLKQLGAGVESRDEQGQTLMHWAAMCGQVQLVATLMECGANIEAKDISGGTPIHEASQWGMVDAVVELKQLGADLESRDKAGQRPMHLAAKNGHVQVIATLKQLGADFQSEDNQGKTPMHSAAYKGKEQAIATLKEYGAHVEAKDNYGRTPMHDAASFGHGDAIVKLKELGADLSATDQEGKTPLDLAIKEHSACAPNPFLKMRVKPLVAVITKLKEFGAKTGEEMRAKTGEA